MTIDTEIVRYPITRTSVILRAKYGWPRKTVPFNQRVLHKPDNYRTDAAGFVTMCWGIPLDVPHSWGGLNIVSLLTDGWAIEIPNHELKPGDAIGYLGPDAIDPDGGTIVLFERWLGDPGQRVAVTWDHLPITAPGPDQRSRPVDFRWHSYRFRDIIDE